MERRTTTRPLLRHIRLELRVGARLQAVGRRRVMRLAGPVAALLLVQNQTVAK
jgi:hypothetical protein